MAIVHRFLCDGCGDEIKPGVVALSFKKRTAAVRQRVAEMLDGDLHLCRICADIVAAFVKDVKEAEAKQIEALGLETVKAGPKA